MAERNDAKRVGAAVSKRAGQGGCPAAASAAPVSSSPAVASKTKPASALRSDGPDSPANAVEAVFSATRVDGARGVSKTPRLKVSSDSFTNIVSNSADLADGSVDGVSPVGFVNTCVDYLKVTFDGDFVPSDSKWSKLFSILRVDPKVFKKDFGHEGYSDSFVIDEATVFLTGSRNTFSVDGSSTCHFEMKGFGCRLFEERVIHEHPGETSSFYDWQILKAWEALVVELLSLHGRCTRIDLPVDDLSGLVDFEGLKARLQSRSFKSALHCFEWFPSFDSDPNDPVSVRASGGGGYTANIGGLKNVQLGIYNKKAEREAKGFVVTVPSWIRYETRYFHASAVSALAAFAASFGCSKGLEENARKAHSDPFLHGDDLVRKVGELKAGGANDVDAWEGALSFRRPAEETESLVVSDVSRLMASYYGQGKGPAGFIFGCLKGIFAPLEKIRWGRYDHAHGAVWGPWERFVSGFSSCMVFAGARVEMTVVSNARWLDHDTDKALARVWASDPSKALEICRFLLNSGVAKLDERDLQIVNNQRRARRLPPFGSVKELVSACAYSNGGIDILADGDPEVEKLFERKVLALGTARYDADSFGLSDGPDFSKKGGR